MRAQVDLRSRRALTRQNKAEDRENLHLRLLFKNIRLGHRQYRFKSMSCRCQQFRGRVLSTDGSDDVDIILCNDESTGVGLTILNISIYLLPQCEYAKSAPLPLRSPGGNAMSAQWCPTTDDLLYSRALNKSLLQKIWPYLTA